MDDYIDAPLEDEDVEEREENTDEIQLLGIRLLQ